MVAPVTGPVTQNKGNTLDGPGSLYYIKTGYKQKPPYNLVTAYKLSKVECLSAIQRNLPSNQLPFAGYAKANTTSRSNWQCAVPLAPFTEQYATEKALADTLAREAFRDALGDASAWLVNLAEKKQSVSMIATRAMQLRKFAVLLRRGQPFLAIKQLEAAGHPTNGRIHKYHKSRSFADNFLEYHFGWAPLVSDIYNSVDILQRDVPYGNIRAKGRKVRVDSPYFRRTSGPYGTETISGRCQGFLRTYCGADVAVSNPNLWLANQMGLVNPATLAWEVVPFSFVVDWFTTAGSFLQQWTDFLGLQIANPWSTTKGKFTGEGHYLFVPKPSGPAQSVDALFNGIFIDRTTSIPTVSLGKRQVTRLSVSRALTSISLLIQKGLKGKFS